MEKLKFENLNLSKEMKKAISDMGFEEPSPIQEQAIPHILEGRDVIGQSQTGTGKTAAFGIPTLERIDPKNKSLQALILCPTRELAIQVAEEFKKLTKYKREIDTVPVYGGQPIERQIKALRMGAQVVIGTPGRVMDHIERRTLKIENVKTVILDEADEMLNMGFVEDIEFILKRVPEERQTLLFSATMPKPIMDLTKKFQKNPQILKLVHHVLTVSNIDQTYFEVKESNKLEVLSRLIDIHNPKLSLVFCNTKRKVDEVVENLQTRGYYADGLHGDLKQTQRDRVMSKFRSGKVEILVATDVAARGIDVDDVEIVFNYDVPQDEEYYVHRIGRTGRAGRVGRSFTFVAGRDAYKLRDIQRYIKTKIKLQAIPSISDVQEMKKTQFIDNIRNIISEGSYTKYVNWVEQLLEEDVTSLDVAAALIHIALNDNNNGAKENVKEHNYENTGAEEGMVRLFINLGRNQNISPKDIVGSIAGETNMPGKLIGAIDIFDKYTFVEVPKEYAKEVVMVMSNKQIKGKKINIEPANKR
jgi:ATP-dependent RNA helicase DeaD